MLSEFDMAVLASAAFRCDGERVGYSGAMRDEADAVVEEVLAHYNRVTAIEDRRASDLGDPRKAIAKLREYRAEARALWTPVVWSALQLVRRIDLEGASRFVADDVFERVTRQALWAVTEVRPASQFKLLSQRFLSRSVYEHWLQVVTAGPNKSTVAFEKSPSDGETVQHEHVIPIDRLRRELRTAESQDAVLVVLSKAEACVVTKREASSLNTTGGDGWDRYRRREVEVWDREAQAFRYPDS
jgi:hypothetical protein